MNEWSLERTRGVLTVWERDTCFNLVSYPLSVSEIEGKKHLILAWRGKWRCALPHGGVNVLNNIVELILSFFDQKLQSVVYCGGVIQRYGSKNGANLQSSLRDSASNRQEIGLFQKECKAQKSVSWLFSEDSNMSPKMAGKSGLKLSLMKPRHQACP